MKFGIIGSNFIVREFLSAAKRVDAFELESMYSRSLEKAEQFGKEYGAKEFFDNYLTMFEEGNQEAIYIASPISLHYEQAKKALECGMHVLLEKVAVTKKEEIKQLIDLSIEKNLTFMEAMIPTTTPAFRVLKDNLHKVGAIRRVVMSYNQYSSRYDKFKNGIVENAFNPAFGGGALTDIGIYLIEPVVHLFGKPNRVIGKNYRLDNGIIGQGTAMLDYGDFEAVLMYSKITDSDTPCQIIGENGVLECTPINRLSKVVLKERKKEPIILYDKPEETLMTYEIEEFIRCVQNGQPSSDLNSHEQTRIAVELVEEIGTF